MSSCSAAVCTLLHSPDLLPTSMNTSRRQFPDVCCWCLWAHSRHDPELIFPLMSGLHVWKRLCAHGASDPHSRPHQSVCLLAGGHVLQRCRSLPDVRPLQQLLLQPQAVIRLPVGVRAAAQQRGRSCAQRSVCGKKQPGTLKQQAKMMMFLIDLFWSRVNTVFTLLPTAHYCRFCKRSLVDVSSCMVRRKQNRSIDMA